MLYETIPLSVPGADGPAQLTAYVPEAFPELGPDRKRPALIICPGGGYNHLSNREGEPVALRFAGLGYAVFLLHYSLECWPIPQRQLLAAIDHVRSNAERYHVRPDAVVPLGFSAGGHLAACSGTMWNKPEIYRPLKKKSPAFRPDALVLCYPVITSGSHAHRESFVKLLGDRYDELLDAVSIEKHVSRKTPPVFLWHTADDTTVPVENTLLMDKALEAKGVDHETRVYPHGSHGQSLADRTVFAPDAMHRLSVPCSVWVSHCDAWLQHHFGDTAVSQEAAAPVSQ